MNKTVLLRERKRHTACRVASARSAVCFSRGGGGGWWVPLPDLAGGVPDADLAKGYPILTWPGEYPCSGVPHWSRIGVPPPSQDGYTPPPQERTWDQRPGKQAGTGVPPLERTWYQRPGKQPGTGITAPPPLPPPH